MLAALIILLLLVLLLGGLGVFIAKVFFIGVAALLIASLLGGGLYIGRR
jgi:hypothetical protein